MENIWKDICFELNVNPNDPDWEAKVLETIRFLKTTEYQAPWMEDVDRKPE